MRQAFHHSAKDIPAALIVAGGKLEVMRQAFHLSLATEDRLGWCWDTLLCALDAMPFLIPMRCGLQVVDAGALLFESDLVPAQCLRHLDYFMHEHDHSLVISRGNDNACNTERRLGATLGAGRSCSAWDDFDGRLRAAGITDDNAFSTERRLGATLGAGRSCSLDGLVISHGITHDNACNTERRLGTDGAGRSCSVWDDLVGRLRADG